MNLKEKITADCAKNIKEEICGFIIRNENGFDIKPTTNKSTDPENEFYIPSKEFLRIKRNENLVAIYHSHIRGSARPSEFDKKTSELVCYPFVIFSTQENNFDIYKPEFLDAEEKDLKELEKELK